jgi:glutathione peroxidase
LSKLYDFTLPGLDGEERSLADFKGQACLIVNVASKCGLTPQYDGLQRLHDRFRDRGFSVIGFPCNQFGGQEPGSADEIQDFCTTNFGVTFPMYSKVEVNGDGRSPIYEWLTSTDTQPDGSGDIAWNFAKFVIDRSGAISARFAPQVEPESLEIREVIEKALG